MHFYLVVPDTKSVSPCLNIDAGPIIGDQFMGFSCIFHVNALPFLLDLRAR